MFASFAHQIQSQYYVVNRSVSIGGITLYHFIASTHPIPLSVPPFFTHHYVFHSLFSDERKHDSVTTVAHNKNII